MSEKTKTEYKKILIMNNENAEHTIQHEATGWLITETEQAFYAEYCIGNMTMRRDRLWFPKSNFYYKIIQ